MFAQIKNGRIVRLSETKNDGDIKLELPEDFDFDRFDRYEVVDGVLIKHDIPGTEEKEEPSLQEQIAELRANLDRLLALAGEEA